MTKLRLTHIRAILHSSKAFHGSKRNRGDVAVGRALSFGGYTLLPDCLQLTLFG